jgi:hypothetical protein
VGIELGGTQLVHGEEMDRKVKIGWGELDLRAERRRIGEESSKSHAEKRWTGEESSKR